MKKALMVLLLMLVSRSALAAELQVVDPWVRLMPPVAQASAGYLVLKNGGDTDVSVIGVTCDVAKMSDLHGMRMQDGKMVMFPLDSVVVPAHGQYSFAPGSVHIMLMGLTAPLKQGQVVNIVLHLADGQSIDVKAPVRDARAGHGMHMH